VAATNTVQCIPTILRISSFALPLLLIHTPFHLPALSSQLPTSKFHDHLNMAEGGKSSLQHFQHGKEVRVQNLIRLTENWCHHEI